MNTPICDFVHSYAKRRGVRMHMPGHKGIARLGPEPLDITEISGADELYHARGVIRESEENAAALFGSARTVYGAETLEANADLDRLFRVCDGPAPDWTPPSRRTSGLP